MKSKKALFISTLIPMLWLNGCGLNSQSVQNNQYSSSKKGKNNMPTQSPMLNEIFAIPQNKVPRWKSISVNHIVTKYIPLGSSKEEVKQILEKMNQHYKEEDNVIHAGYFKQLHPFIPTPGVQITLRFNQLGFLENIESDFNYSE